ncbi:hypothetical protein N0V93_009064 [Gnomoniopsis smithogilvyi]|uniref:Fungal N-terminal domain-containing protein n=1 Tax=Gnomoniopsis smithogilvyi TaxID=1191159 RepID=A0A9W9CSF9_9PEZI|nr:hypothetical protein N0V93_009064 [Gnomoniopsis smithogilvyi]
MSKRIWGASEEIMSANSACGACGVPSSYLCIAFLTLHLFLSSISFQSPSLLTDVTAPHTQKPFLPECAHVRIMDPVSAIGLASSIIAILDFSWELVAGTWEIYRSPDGTSDENAQLEDVIEDLKSLTDSLASQAQIPAKTTAENKIKRLAQYCQEDSQTLLDLLSGLRIVGKRRTIWRSLNSKWKSILKKNEVAQLKAQLQENRAEIQFHLTVMIQ